MYSRFTPNEEDVGLRAIDKEKKYWFIPDISGNRKDPEPTMVLVSTLTDSDIVKKILDDDMSESVSGPATKEQRAESTVAEMKTIFMNHVHEIKNFLDESGQPIGDLNIAWDGMVPDLRMAIVNAIRFGRGLTDSIKKN